MPRTTNRRRPESFCLSEWKDSDPSENSQDSNQNDDEFINLNNVELFDSTNLLAILNKQVSLQDILRSFSVKFTETPSPSGWSLKSCCPFKDHRDSSPSFFYNQQENIFNCFGCSRGGGPVQFVSYYYDLTTPEAIDKLVSEYKNSLDFDDLEESIPDVNISSIVDLLSEYSDFHYHFLKNHDFSNQAFEYIKNINMLFDCYIQTCIKNKSFNREAISARILLCKNKMDQFKG